MNVLRNVLLHVMFGSLGAIVYALFGSLVGIGPSIWSGGKALFPLYYCLMAVWVGAIPFELLLRVYLSWRSLRIGIISVMTTGFTLGFLVFPMFELMASMLTELPVFRGLAFMTAVLSVLSVAWTVSAMVSLLAGVGFGGMRIQSA